MGIWRREESVFNELPTDRQANIDVVSSAYDSVTGDKAYLTMPITSGRRYYQVLDQYGVRTIQELEQKRPGALREEIIIPNLAEGRELAERLAPELDVSLVNPGAFEGRKQRWSQDEYMVLWLRLLTASVKELYLSDGWEYSNGGAMEFARGLMIHYRFVDGREDRMHIYDHAKRPFDIIAGAHKLAEAIRDLDRRGYPTDVLRAEFSHVAGIAAYAADPMTDFWDEYSYHFGFGGPEWFSVLDAAKSVGVSAALE